MDESPIKDGPEIEEAQAPAEVEEAPQPKAPAATEVVFEGLASGKEPWRGGSGCSSRLPLYGCLFGLVLLIGILFIGTSMMRRTVWVNLEKARRAVVQSLPRDLPVAERQRTIDNLERLRAMLEASKDPYPVMGEFVSRVRELLQDGRFTAEEVGGLNVFIERKIEESGIPPLQIGFRISDFGFRIFHPPSRDFFGCVRVNSEFRIPNCVPPPESREILCRRVLQGPPRSRCRVIIALVLLNDPLAGRKRPAYKILSRPGGIPMSELA